MLAVLAVLPARKVVGADMAPSVLAGEWAWILPLTPIRGDIVALHDPLDPSRTILRRAIAGDGNTVAYEDGVMRVGIKRVRQKEMGTDATYNTLEETMWSKPPARANTWLIRRRATNVRWKIDAVSIPDHHWFLMADDRDGALDSRWWGTIPEADLLGVVRLRVGEADAWRAAVQWLDPIP